MDERLFQSGGGLGRCCSFAECGLTAAWGRFRTAVGGREGESGAASTGLEKLAAEEIYNNSRQANADAGSFRERMTREDAKSDLRVSATECAGTVEVSQLGSFEIVRKGNHVWADLDASLTKWVNSQFGIKLSAETWIHGTPSHPLMRGFVSWCQRADQRP